MTFRSLLLTALVAPLASAAPASPDGGVAAAGLDLSETAAVQSLLVVPPIVKVTTKQGGAFAGLNTAKTVEKFDAPGHQKLVAALSKELEGKVIPAETAFGAVVRAGATPASLRTQAGREKLAQATNVAWLVTFDFNKTGALVGTLFDEKGNPAGEPSYVTNAAGLTQKNADDMASFVAKQLIAVADARAKAKAAEEAARLAAIPKAPPPPETRADDFVDPDEAARLKRKAEAEKKAFKADADRSRLSVAVGPGVTFRGLEVGGENAGRLAELRNTPTTGLAVYANVQPLQWFDKTAKSRFSDLEIDVHYRRAIVQAKVTEGPGTGTVCQMTDDDLMVRGTYRIQVAAKPHAPWIGVGGGFSQENTIFACDVALPSSSFRGIDAQLRIRQPIVPAKFALEASVGPRFILGTAGLTPGFSLAGELWAELKPVSVFFGRAGVRVSRLVAANEVASLVDTRTFIGLELGVFF